MQVKFRDQANMLKRISTLNSPSQRETERNAYNLYTKRACNNEEIPYTEKSMKIKKRCFSSEIGLCRRGKFGQEK